MPREDWKTSTLDGVSGHPLNPHHKPHNSLTVKPFQNPSPRAEELEAAVAENRALRAQAARSATLKEQHAQLLQRLRGERERADAAVAQRDAALHEAAALQQRVWATTLNITLNQKLHAGPHAPFGSNVLRHGDAQFRPEIALCY